MQAGLPIYCADTIGRYGDRFVVIERLNNGGKLAIPGGKQEVKDGVRELLSVTAVREPKEETGLDFTLVAVLASYAEEGRDPRGQFNSTVFIANAIGRPRDEPGKTRVHLMTRREIEARYTEFAFDHAKIFQDYFLHFP
jgi:ADP-ribose pyrophosphatase YjhB (NUDIX family)